MNNNPPKLKSVFLLSDKASGSSALQVELLQHPKINIVEKTRHYQNETLYWNKAAALLGMPQAKME